MQGVKAQGTRLERKKQNGIEPRFVELEAGDYLLDALVRMGLCLNDPMTGQTALPYADILAFSNATGRISEPWEMEALHDMSRAYLEGLAYGARNVRTEPIDMG